VTGYITPAAQYCAITGGNYTITGNSNTDNEQGTCIFKDGTVCDVWDYYNGKCIPGAAPTATAGLTIQPLSIEVCDGQAQAMAHTLEVLAGTKAEAPVEVTQSEAPLSDFVNDANGTGCLATVTGTSAQFESPDAVVNALGSMLEEQVGHRTRNSRPAARRASIWGTANATRFAGLAPRGGRTIPPTARKTNRSRPVQWPLNSSIHHHTQQRCGDPRRRGRLACADPAYLRRSNPTRV